MPFEHALGALPPNDRPVIDLSVVVPVFNEAGVLYHNIHELITALDKLPNAPSWELLLIEDGSSDRSLSVAMRLAAEESRIAVCIHGTNRGIDAAMRTGWAAARGTCTIVVDADLSYDPAHVGRLHAALLAGAEIAVASPYMRGGSVSGVREFVGGYASGVTVSSGGLQAVESSGTASATVIGGGEQVFVRVARGARVVDPHHPQPREVETLQRSRERRVDQQEARARVAEDVADLGRREAYHLSSNSECRAV